MPSAIADVELEFRSPALAAVAWVLAGPLTPAFWIWLAIDPQLYENVSQVSWRVYGWVWMLTGLPSAAAVSLGYARFARLNSKTSDNVSLIVFGTATLVWLATVVMSVVVIGLSGASAISGLLSAGALAALIMAILSYWTVRLIALKPVEKQPVQAIATAPPNR